MRLSNDHWADAMAYALSATSPLQANRIRWDLVGVDYAERFDKPMSARESLAASLPQRDYGVYKGWGVEFVARRPNWANYAEGIKPWPTRPAPYREWRCKVTGRKRCWPHQSEIHDAGRWWKRALKRFNVAGAPGGG